MEKTTWVIIGLGVLLFLASLGLAWLVNAVKKLKQKRSIGLVEPKSLQEYNQLFKAVPTMNISQREVLLSLLFERPIEVTKVLTGNKSWLLNIKIFDPEESTIPPREIDEMLKEITR